MPCQPFQSTQDAEPRLVPVTVWGGFFPSDPLSPAPVPPAETLAYAASAYLVAAFPALGSVVSVFGSPTVPVPAALGWLLDQSLP